VRMARLAALRRWTWGGASLKSNSALCMNYKKALEASLSSRWRRGRRSREVSKVCARLKVARVLGPDVLVMA
jgi:hypothetical protein